MKNLYQNYSNQLKFNEITKQKIILYLTKVVFELNSKYKNLIKEEKYMRAIKMFTSMEADYETIKKIINWHADNEIKQFVKI